MNIKLIQTPDEITIDTESIKLSRLKMTIDGSFVAEIMGNVDVDINYDDMSIRFLNQPTESFFKYNGNVRFKNIQAFDTSNKRVQVKYHYNGDEWRNVQDSFNRAVVEYTHYNRSILLEEQLQTIVFYKPKDRLMYARKEGLNMRAIVAKPIEKNSLKKLRGNYVRH